MSLQHTTDCASQFQSRIRLDREESALHILLCAMDRIKRTIA
jgi:hypothetical protein